MNILLNYLPAISFTRITRKDINMSSRNPYYPYKYGENTSLSYQNWSRSVTDSRSAPPITGLYERDISRSSSGSNSFESYGSGTCVSGLKVHLTGTPTSPQATRGFSTADNQRQSDIETIGSLRQDLTIEKGKYDKLAREQKDTKHKLEAQIQHDEAIIRHNDTLIRHIQRSSAMMKQKHDAVSRRYYNTTIDIYEDIRGILVTYLQDKSQIPPRKASQTCESNEEGIKTMTTILKHELNTLTKEYREREYYRNTLAKKHKAEMDAAKQAEDNAKRQKNHLEEEIVILKSDRNAAQDELRIESRKLEAIIRERDSQIEKMHTTVDTLDKARQDLEEKLKILERKKIQITKVEEMEVEEMRNFAFADGMREGIRNCHTQNDEEIRQLQRQINEIETEKTELTAKLSKQENMLSQKVDELNREKRRTQQVKDTCEDKLSEAQKDVDELNDAYDECQQKLRNTNALLEEMREVNEPRYLKEEYDQKLAINESKFDQERIALKQLLKDRDEGTKRIRHEMEKAMQECKTHLRQQSSDKEQLKTQSDTIEQMNKQIKQLQQTNSKWEGQIAELETELNQTKNMLQVTDEDVKREQLESAHMETKLKEKDEAISKLDKRLSELEQTKEEQESKMREIRNEGYAEGVREGYDKCKSETDKEIKKLESCIAIHNGEKAKHTKHIKEAESEIKGLKTMNQNQKQSHFKELKDREEVIERLRQELNKNKQIYETLSDRSANQSKEIDEKGQIIKQQQHLIAENEREKSEHETKISQCMDSKDVKIKEELIRQQLISQQAASELMDTKQEMELLQTRVNELEQIINEHNRKAEEVEKTAYDKGIKEGYDRGKSQNKETERDLHTKIEEGDRIRAKLEHELKLQQDKLRQEESSHQAQERQMLEANQAQLREADNKVEELQSMNRQKDEEIKTVRSESNQKAAELLTCQHDVAQLNRKLKELEELIKEKERQMEEKRQEGYWAGVQEGYGNGLCQSAEEKNSLQSKTVEQDKEISALKTELTQNKDALHKTNEKHRKEKEVTEFYNKQILEKDEEIKKLRATNHQSGKQYNRIEELEQQVAMNESKFDQERLELQKQIKGVQQALHNHQEMYKELSKENSRNVDRLAAEMNAKVSSDESALENISIQARPMKIAEDYTLLLSNAWLDAKTELDEVDTEDVTEADKVILLLNILMICEQEANTLHAQIVQMLGKTLRDPVQKLIPGVSNLPQDGASDTTAVGPDTTEAKEATEPGPDLPQNVMTVIGDYFRMHSSTANLDLLQQRVTGALQSKYGDKADIIDRSLHIQDVRDFVTESVRLAWKMVIQRPPMTFDTSQIGQPWNKDGFLDLMWGSNPNAEGAVIQYYKGPQLLHAGKAMVKGAVFVHSVKNPQK